MKLAEIYVRQPSALDVPKWKFLVPACAIGLALTGLAGWAGFPWRLYNDIPSLVGYTSLALIVYKAGIPIVNKFFCYTNKFSYEWYLVHILVFHVTMYFTKGKLPLFCEIAICLLLSYLVAMGYARLFIKNQTIVKGIKI